MNAVVAFRDFLWDRLSVSSYSVSVLIHIIALLMLPGQGDLIRNKPPDWLEVDLMTMPDIQEIKPEIASISTTNESAANQNDSEEIDLGNSPLFPAPPVWLPEVMSRLDEQPQISGIVLPSDLAIDTVGTASSLPGLLNGILEKIPDARQVDLDSAPDLDWEPSKNALENPPVEDINTFVIEGPIAKRKIIYQPPLPKPISDISGTVRLKFWVRPDGTVGQIVPILKADPKLESIAIEFLEKWRFESVNESFGDQWGSVPIRFKLN